MKDELNKVQTDSTSESENPAIPSPEAQMGAIEELYAAAAEAGVEVTATRYLGQLHGFWRHPSAFPSAEPLMRQVAGFLQLHG